MKNSIQITQNNKFNFFYSIIIKVILIYIAVIIFYMFYKSPNTSQMLLPSVILFIYMSSFILFPLLILYINHFNNNKNDILIYDSENKNFKFCGNSKYEFNSDDIDQVIYKMSYAAYEKRINWLFWDKYFYVVIVLKNSSKIILSCLLVPSDMDLFPIEKIVREKKLFPIIPKKRHYL
jgi:hypothetical protein